MSYGSPQDGWQQPQGGIPPQGAATANPYGQQFARESKATLALILSIVGFFCCGIILGPVAIFLGKQEMDAIDQGLTDPSERGKAKAAFIIGIIVTVLAVLATIFYITLIASGAGTQ